MTDRGSRPDVSVVVPARNEENHIGDCVSSLLRTQYPDARKEIVVVDNGSTDGTAAVVRPFPVRYLMEPTRGTSNARNTGIESSRGEIVAFVDADCVVSSSWLSELTAPFAGPDTWGVAGEIVPHPPTTPAQRYHAARKPRWQKPALESRWWPFAVTANVAYRREVFERVGLFDPLFPTAQDKDFGRRYLDAGLDWVYRPSALVLHRLRPTGWALFRQHVGWGMGAALLHRKYGLRWGWRDELRKYAELVAEIGKLPRDALSSMGQSHRSVRSLSHNWYEVLRRTGLRVGALRGMLRPRPEGWPL